MEDLTPAQASRQGLLEMWAAIDAHEVAKSKGPQNISLNRRMQPSAGGRYGVATGINAPRDPVSGVPIVGAG